MTDADSIEACRNLDARCEVAMKFAPCGLDRAGALPSGAAT